MIKYTIRQNWRDHIERNLKNEKLNERTIADWKKSQYVGLAGELCFARFLDDNGIDFDYCGDKSYDFDFACGDTFIDVKSRCSNFIPVPYGTDFAITDYLEFQRTDIYVFTAVCEKEIYLLGWEHKDRFWNHEHAVKWKAGDKRSQSIVKADCTSLKVCYLAPMESLLTYLSVKDENSTL